MTTFHRILAALWILHGALFLTPVLATVLTLARAVTNAVEPMSLIPLGTLALLSGGVAALSLANGIFMLQRRHHRASLIFSAVLCLCFPLGTLLGGLSWFILSRPVIKASYLGSMDSNRSLVAPPV